MVAENQIISTYGFEIPFYIDGGGDYNQQPGAGTYINTPKGTRVFLSFKQDMSAVYKTKVKDYLAGVYPNAYFLGEATWKYNCHAYAWYFQNSSGMGWMNSPAAYWQDGSYFRVLSPMASDKVYYSAQDHSAILRSLPSADSPYSVAQVTSKWSQAGLYTHKAADCPYWTSSTDLKFYRKA